MPLHPSLLAGPALPWLGTAVLVASITVMARLLGDAVPREAVGMVFMAAVAAAASLSGLGVALYAAMLGFVAWDMFFFYPLYSITIGSVPDGVAMAVFVLAAGATAILAGRLRAQLQAGRARIVGLGRIVHFSRRLGEPTSVPELLAEVARQGAKLGTAAVVLTWEPDGLVVAASVPGAVSLDSASWLAARHCAETRAPAGWGTAMAGGAAWRFGPIGTVRSLLGVIGVQPPRDSGFDRPTLLTFSALADQAALALERVQLATEAARAAAMQETQKLRTALLNSLSHDLRTPLTGIRGAAETLALTWDSLAPACRADLLASIIEDTGRMTRFLANIMDMTRLESGQILPRLASVDVQGAVEAALARLPEGPVALEMEPGLPPVLADPALIEQVLVNVLDNAQRYGAQGAPVRVRAGRSDDGVVIEVADEGMGIPPNDLPHVFDSFYRAQRGDRVAPGTGLGLAIARGLMEAMHGSIAAQSPRPDAPAAGPPGTAVTLRLPAATA